MKASENAIDRRKFLRLLGWGVLGTATILTVSDMVQKAPWPRILPDRITRTVGDTAMPIPESWYRALPRISVEGVPLNKAKIDSLPMLPVNDKGYCKSGEAVKVQGYGIKVPDLYEKLGMDYEKTGRRVIAKAADLYALIPAEPDKAIFSASKNNIPREFWSGEGFETAKSIMLTPYGFFPQDGKAWHKISDCNMISAYKGDSEPGSYFLYPDGRIILSEDKDVSMSLDSLVIMINNTPIKYERIKKLAESNLVKNNVHGIAKEVPSIPVHGLIGLAGINPEGKTLVLHANRYAVSIPSYRQEDGRIVFDERNTSRFGTPAQFDSRYSNNASQIKGVYRIEVV
jgi:hypothetical protein